MTVSFLERFLLATLKDRTDPVCSDALITTFSQLGVSEVFANAANIHEAADTLIQKGFLRVTPHNKCVATATNETHYMLTKSGQTAAMHLSGGLF